MLFEESEKVELKLCINSNIAKEIIAFVNTFGGTIYVGVDNNGTICGIDNFDFNCQQIANIVRDTIKPDVSMFVSYEKLIIDTKVVLKITVQQGTARPYYISCKGLKPEGVFVRHGTTSAPSSQENIRKMIKETDGNDFESVRALNQDLSYNKTEQIFSRRSILFNEPQKISLGLENKEGIYSNLGFILSDQNSYTIKAAVFQSDDETVFLDRKEFSGPIFEQIDSLFRFIEIYNQNRGDLEGIYRRDTKSYPDTAIREAVFNMIVHRDYSFSASSFVKLYKDRIEFISIGGLFPGLTLDDIKTGISVCRNKKLAEVFYRLKLIEAYGTGIKKIYGAYKTYDLKPEIIVTDNAFKIILPNVNSHSQNNELISEQKAVYIIKNNPAGIKRSQIQETLNMSLSSCTRLLNSLIDNNIIYKQGNGKNTVYRYKNS
ncbi:MAG: putative DNA binding domain-containing protein [Sphaerochaetaceae bacterium]|nr:putative DNA binding domain-containing protein [Sphaerochaetaceae bacterium]